MNEIITQLCRAGYLKDVQDRDFEYDGSSVNFEAGALLNEFVRKVQPKKTIETGMAYGISTLCICQAHRGRDRARRHRRSS